MKRRESARCTAKGAPAVNSLSMYETLNLWVQNRLPHRRQNLQEAQDDRFVIVSIKGEEFLVFESDIRKGGEFLSPGLVQGP